MLNDVEERVSRLIQVVTGIGKESEGVYLTMGRLFPAIIAETERSASLAGEALMSFSAGLGARGGKSIEEMNSFVDEAGEWFRGLHQRDEGFLKRINESMEHLASLDGLIKGVRADSEDMEIISLNAMTVALKSGLAGKAFSVITDELKGLSGQTIDLTESITGRGQALLDVFSTLRDAVGRLDRFQDDFFEKLESSLTGAFDRHRAELEGARDLLSKLVADARDIRAPVLSIMQEVQHQDIVRQSLEHVVISLSEAEEAARRRTADGASEEEEIAYVASIARLSTQLLDDIIAKVDASVGAFAANIDGVETRVGAIDEQRRAFVAQGADVAAGSDATSETGRYLELKKAVTATARKLAEQVRSLDDSFKRFSILLSRFRNIVVASRIEIAKNRSLSGVSTTVNGMVELTHKIEEDVGGAMGTTKDFTKVAEAAISEYAEGAEDGEKLGVVLDEVRRDLDALESGRAAMRKAIVDFRLFTSEFLAYIKDARVALGELKRLSERLGAARSELIVLEEHALGALGGKVDREIHSGRLQDMIQRFTIFTHKRAAGEIAHFRVEDGRETGEVTLF